VRKSKSLAFHRPVSAIGSGEVYRYSLSFRFIPASAYSLRNVTLGSRRLARRPGIATAAIAEVASNSRAAASTGADTAPAW
jgi:hypothetical protein